MPGTTGGGSNVGPARGATTPRADSGVCAISPSDLVGYTGNLINRVNELEQRIAQLEAGNVEANQLSDLAQQVGWVSGITYMGTPGWTQTEYGTLIPPPGVSFSSLGFTLSDGNTYPMVVMDEDGVLQYGFSDTGQVAGASSGGNVLCAGALSQSLAFNSFVNFSTAFVENGITLSGDTITMQGPGTFVATLQAESLSWDVAPGSSNTLHIRFFSDIDAAASPVVQFFEDAGSGGDPLVDCKTVVFHKTESGSFTLKIRNVSSGTIDIACTLTVVQLNGS